MSDAKPPASGPAKPGAAGPGPVVADLGSRSRKSIKKLRRGRGPLLEDAQKLIQQLQAEAGVAAGAQPVIVIVKERRKCGTKFA
jgi:hypothetical protein